MTYTLESAAKIGTAACTAARTYGQTADFIRYCAANLTLCGEDGEPSGDALLKTAIGKAASMPTKTDVQKRDRKKALAGWTGQLKRERQGDKPAKGETDTRPYLAFTVEGTSVTSIYWKTPEPKADEGGEGGEGDGQEQGDPNVGITLAQAIARIKAASREELGAIPADEVEALMMLFSVPA